MGSGQRSSTPKRRRGEEKRPNIFKGTGNILQDLISSRVVLQRVVEGSHPLSPVRKGDKCHDQGQGQEVDELFGCGVCQSPNENRSFHLMTKEEMRILDEVILTPKTTWAYLSTGSSSHFICGTCSKTLERLERLKKEIGRITASIRAILGWRERPQINHSESVHDSGKGQKLISCGIGELELTDGTESEESPEEGDELGDEGTGDKIQTIFDCDFETISEGVDLEETATDDVKPVFLDEIDVEEHLMGPDAPKEPSPLSMGGVGVIIKTEEVAISSKE